MDKDGLNTNEEDLVFKLIEDWPERFGTSEWRNRAHRELDGRVHEAFISYANGKNDLSDERDDSVSEEWELFCATRAKLYRRQRALDLIAGFFDGVAGVAAVFMPIWFLVWFYAPSADLAVLLGVHLAIILGWGVLKLVQWQYALREKRRLRFTDRPA